METLKNTPYKRGIDNDITEKEPFRNTTTITRSMRRGSGYKRDKRMKQQIISYEKQVECPIYGHPANAVPNPGSAYSTHYIDGGLTFPYRITKKFQKIIYHK